MCAESSKLLQGLKQIERLRERKKDRYIERKEERKKEKEGEKEEERQAGSFYIKVGSKVFKQYYANTERKTFGNFYRVGPVL